LAVGRDGTRLGQGGGWYDKALAGLPDGVPVLAMINPAELLERNAIKREPHDIPVNGALLPTGIVWL
jgi:5-formyltetrahydrofolate cyclo-ligase